MIIMLLKTKRMATSIPRLKVLSIGDMGVGKSCLIKRYCEDRVCYTWIVAVVFIAQLGALFV